jgi:hypothetical protein
MTDTDEEDTWSKGSGDDGSPESVCDDVVEVVEIYTSVESFCVCRTVALTRGEVRLSDSVGGFSCVSCVHT